MAEILEVLGGPVTVDRERHGVNYTADVMAHPYLTRLPLEKRLLILAGSPRRSGTKVTLGGCATWAPERFLSMVATSQDLGEAFAAVLGEKNFVSDALGVRDHDAARGRLAARLNEYHRAAKNVYGVQLHLSLDCRWRFVLDYGYGGSVWHHTLAEQGPREPFTTALIRAAEALAALRVKQAAA